MPQLVLPTTSVHESFLEAMDEFVAEGVESSQTAAWIDHNAPGWREPGAFAAFVEAVRADALLETPRPDWHVPCTTLWWIDGDDYLGRIAIRHELNDFLLDVGGHIGYDVRPSRRREGHATGMLKQSLAVGARPRDRPCSGHLRRRQRRLDPGDRGCRRRSWRTSAASSGATGSRRPEGRPCRPRRGGGMISV